MAWIFLKAQGVSPIVSDISIHAGQGKVERAIQATVSGFKKEGGRLSFQIHATALPFPIAPSARCLLDKLPIEQDLNLERLTVKGLPAGHYTLTIDGIKIADYAPDQLAAGITLGFNEKTPQYRQAMQVFQSNYTRHRTEQKLRNYAAVRWFLGHRHIAPDNLEAVRAYWNSLDGEKKKEWYERQIPAYLREWPTHETVVRSLEKQDRNLRSLAQPKPHLYDLTRIR